MSRTVQFDHYGPADVLRVVDVPPPAAGDGHVLVRVAAAGINPGEIAIRNGTGVTSFSAVRAVALQPGEVVAVSATTGGVGGLAAQTGPPRRRSLALGGAGPAEEARQRSGLHPEAGHMHPYACPAAK